VGVAVVWLVLPDDRAVEVITSSGASRHGPGERLPARAELPDLSPLVDELFVQLGARG